MPHRLFKIFLLSFFWTLYISFSPVNSNEKHSAIILSFRNHLKSYIQGTPLKRALLNAYAYNTDLKDRRSFLRASDESLLQAFAEWKPTLSAQAKLSSQKTIYSGDGKTGTNLNLNEPALSGSLINTAQGSITLNQNLYNGEGTLARTHIAKSAIKAAQSQLQVIEQRILLTTVQTCLELFSKRAQINLFRNNEQFLRKTLEAAQTQFSAGGDTQTSVAQAQAQLDEIIAKRRTAEAEFKNLEARYERLTGTPLIPLEDLDSFSLPFQNREEVLDIAIINNPALRTALFERDVAHYTLDKERSELLPRIDLQGSVGQTITRGRYDGSLIGTNISGSLLSNDRTTNQQLLVTLSYPLYEAGLARSKIRQAHLTSEQKRIAVEAIRQQIIEQLTQAWENYLSSQENIKNYADQIESFQISLVGTQEEVRLGSKILLDVLNEQNKLLEAQLNLVNSKKLFYLSGFQLLNAMGLLTAQSLGLEMNDDPPYPSDLPQKTDRNDRCY
jgi:TolC family type I secretion outer membrane protein